MWGVLGEEIWFEIDLLLILLCIIRHGNVNIAKLVVPIKGQGAVVFSFYEFGAFKIGTYRIKDMIGILLGPMFYTKVINIDE